MLKSLWRHIRRPSDVTFRTFFFLNCTFHTWPVPAQRSLQTEAVACTCFCVRIPDIGACIAMLFTHVTFLQSFKTCTFLSQITFLFSQPKVFHLLKILRRLSKFSAPTMAPAEGFACNATCTTSHVENDLYTGTYTHTLIYTRIQHTYKYVKLKTHSLFFFRQKSLFKFPLNTFSGSSWSSLRIFGDHSSRVYIPEPTTADVQGNM